MTEKQSAIGVIASHGNPITAFLLCRAIPLQFSRTTVYFGTAVGLCYPNTQGSHANPRGLHLPLWLLISRSNTPRHRGFENTNSVTTRIAFFNISLETAVQ